MSVSAVRGWIAAAAVLLACAGCGYKGPLYLPEHNVTVVTHPAQAGPSSAQPPGSLAKSKSKAPSPPASSPPPAQPSGPSLPPPPPPQSPPSPPGGSS